MSLQTIPWHVTSGNPLTFLTPRATHITITCTAATPTNPVIVQLGTGRVPRFDDSPLGSISLASGATYDRDRTFDAVRIAAPTTPFEVADGTMEVVTVADVGPIPVQSEGG